jgi:hypothetical protein
MILNKMYLSFCQILSLVTIVFISLLKCINCDCGPPGIPYCGFIYVENIFDFQEDFIVEYNCNDQLTLIYNSSRICRKGKWTGRVPKCGKHKILVKINN